MVLYANVEQHPWFLLFTPPWKIGADFAVCATVEERPFQGRVTNDVEMGFSPCGSFDVK